MAYSSAVERLTVNQDVAGSIPAMPVKKQVKEVKKMRNKIATIALILMTCCFSGCGSCSRAWTDIKSDFSNGLKREINVYTANGDLIAHYEGRIDIETNDGGYLKFDLDGKRYIYYNCFVETIAEID